MHEGAGRYSQGGYKSMAERKGEKKAINQEEEEQFWAAGQLGGRTSRSLLNTLYYHNGKLFGLRRGGHGNITASF